MKALVAVVISLALLAGCSEDAGDEPPAAAPAAPVTTAAAGYPAVAGAAATTAPGDFDGDGRADRLLTGRVAAGGGWRIRMELAAGGAAEAELPPTADGVKAVGAAVVDVGPAQVAFAVVGQGAAGVNLGMYVLRSCKVERVTLAGAPAEFPVRAGAGARSGLACQVPGLVAYQATTADGRFYQASTTSYLLIGPIVDEAHRTTSTLGADDTALAPYGKLTCGSLSI